MIPHAGVSWMAVVVAIGCSETPANSAQGLAADGAAAGAGGAAGAGAGGGGAAGGGGPPACSLPDSRIAISIDAVGDGGALREWDASGAITARDASSFVLDTCAPSAGCTPTPTTVRVEAPGIDLGLEAGAFVEVRYRAAAYNGGQIAASVSVTNLPIWDGRPNPVSSVAGLRFVASEGGLAHPGLPFELSSTARACAPPPAGQGVAYAVLVRPGDAGPWTTLEQGASTTLVASDVSWQITVVRAFQLFGQDRPDPFAWWAAAGVGAPAG